jgi:uncharacterized protein YkwD
MKRFALVPVLLAATSLAGCGSAGSPSAPSAPATRVGPMSIGVTDGRLGGAITDTSGDRERELSGGRRIDPRVLRPLPNLNEGVAGAADCANADLAPDASNVSAVSDATFCLLNAERSTRGLTTLKPDPELQHAALLHGSDMVDHAYFAHEGRDGSKPAERIRDAGYLSSGGAWRIGENLAWGTGDLATPRSIMAAWMASPGHRANILQPQYRQIGFGVVAGNPNGKDGSGATYVTEFGAVDRPARTSTRGNGARQASHDRQGTHSAKRRAASRRHRARMRARRSRARRARVALAPRSHRGKIVGRVASTHAGLN